MKVLFTTDLEKKKLRRVIESNLPLSQQTEFSCWNEDLPLGNVSCCGLSQKIISGMCLFLPESRRLAILFLSTPSLALVQGQILHTVVGCAGKIKVRELLECNSRMGVLKNYRQYHDAYIFPCHDVICNEGHTNANIKWLLLMLKGLSFHSIILPTQVNAKIVLLIPTHVTRMFFCFY